MKGNSVDLIEKFSNKISNIDNNSIYKSTLIYSFSKDFFKAINKRGKEELKASLKNLDAGNINATPVNFQIVSCLLVLAIGKYSKSEFLQLIHPLCTDPNNNEGLISKIEPKRSKWRVIRWLQGILDAFKREKFAINPKHPSANEFNLAYEALHLRSKKINLDEYKRLSQQDAAPLSLLTRTIFSRASLQDQVEQVSNVAVEQINAFSLTNDFEAWPPLPESSQLLIEEETTPFTPLQRVAPPLSPPPFPPLPQAIEETGKSNRAADSHVELPATTANGVTPPPLPPILSPEKGNNSRGDDLFNADAIKKIKGSLKKIEVDAEGLGGRKNSNPRDDMHSLIKKGVKLKPVKVNVKTETDLHKETLNDSLAAAIAKKLKGRRDKVAISDSDNDESSNDEWDGNSSSVTVRAEDSQGILSRAEDSGHGSYISLIDENESLPEPDETFKESENVSINSCETVSLFKLNKKAAHQKDAKEPAENSSSQVQVKNLTKLFNNKL